MILITIDSAEETISIDEIDAQGILSCWLIVREEITCSVLYTRFEIGHGLFSGRMIDQYRERKMSLLR